MFSTTDISVQRSVIRSLLVCVLGTSLCLIITTGNGLAQETARETARETAEETAEETAGSNSKTAPSMKSPRFSVRLEPFKRVRISAKQEGFLTTENLTPGTIIKEGEIIAELDTARQLLQAKRLRAEIQALRSEVDDTTDKVRAEQDIRASEYRLQQLMVAGRQTRIPRMEMVEAETKLVSDRAALTGAASRNSQSQYNLGAKEAELELLELDINNSIVLAPFDGTIISQSKHQGESVSPQEPLAEAFRLDYLLASTFFKQDEISLQSFTTISGVVEIDLPGGGVETFEIEDPKTLPRLERDGRYLGVVKIKNKKRTLANGDEVWALLPGMQGKLVVELPPPFESN